MFKRINKNEALIILNNPEAIALDIRDSESYLEGHLDRFVNISQDQMSSFVEDAEKTQPVLVICYHGNSSQMVAESLSMNGFEDVYSIDGGYEGWVN